ncbi:MAG: aromatic compound catabolic protein [Alcaligenaceae bacterium]|nr:MAG: aromatic compound catabolic protein [Alcaligenaceae bacterium]PHY08181.1 MAG: aromatic compound catabolic protein [Alcaligenaceae bacterium]
MTPENTLAQWLEDEQKLLASMPNGRLVGLLDKSKTATMTGMEVMQAVMHGELPNGPMAATCGYMLVALSPGEATLQGNPTESVMNVQGSVHGGWFASILDGAVGNAIHTMLPVGTGYTTLDLSVKMTRPIVPTAGARVRAIGKIIQVGRQIATAEGRIVGPDGKLYAHATTTCLIVTHAKK